MTVTEILGDIAFQIYFLDNNQKRSDDITVLARRYYESGLCTAVAPNMTSKMHFSTNDTYYGQQWPLKNTGQNGGTPGADIDWEIAQQYTNRSFQPPVVALLDAGFDMDHEDLPPSWAWHPYDAAGPDIQIPYVFDDYPGTECGQYYHVWCWHGTATLGVLKAYTNNGIGLAGTESRVNVMPIKIADANGDFDLGSLQRALDWASQPTGAAQIISMSFVCDSVYATTLEPRFRERYLAGVTLIAGAGNGEPGFSSVQYPASSPYVLAVGETNSSDDTAASSGGPALDLVAPAFDIWTLDQEGSDGLNPSHTGASCNSNQNYACHLAGTSLAAPMVAGIAAKLLLRNPWLLGDHVKDSAEVMYATLRNACDRQHYGVANDDYRRVNNAVGWGRVNADRALASISHGDPNNDLQIDVSDALYLIPYIFSGGPAPVPNICTGDANCDGGVDISDAVFIISYVFSGGAAPCKISLHSVCN
ncbi:MAG: S8 family serine peptidase [candidate division Zixibacteria bacterium]|nr:S8 family serine peptidase [candidate division Zixibacteria bacterium]